MWNIQVSLGGNPANDLDIFVTEGDVLSKAIEISKEHQGRLVTVWGFARMRYRIKDGNVDVNQSNYDHYYTIESDDDMASALVWSEVIIHDNEGTVEDELKKLGADEMRSRIMEAICPKETRKDSDMFDVWYRCRMRHYFY